MVPLDVLKYCKLCPYHKILEGLKNKYIQKMEGKISNGTFKSASEEKPHIWQLVICLAFYLIQIFLTKINKVSCR